MKLLDVRCVKCNSLLGKVCGIAEIKCRKCGCVNLIGIAPTSAGFELKIECQRVPVTSGALDVSR